jgi:hypothetical protein
MNPQPVQHQHNDSTQQSSHRDPQQSNASTDSSNYQQRPDFQAFQSHPCITIRWAAEGGQNRHEELTLEMGVVELGWGG